VQRVEALRAKRPRRFEGAVGPDPSGAALARRVARRAVEMIPDPRQILPLNPLLAGKAAVIFPRLSDLAARIMIEPVFADEKKFIRDRWKGGTPGVELYGLDPTDDEIVNAAAAAGRADVTVFFCYDAHLHPRQKLLLDSLHQASRQVVMVLMRDPYDREYLEEKDAGVCIFGWRACQIEAGLETILGKV
jgi:hypothetical protein